MTTQLLEDAKADLSSNMVPAPEDLLSEVAPLTRLYFTEQVVYECLNNFVAMASESEDDPDAQESHLPAVIEALAVAGAALDKALALLGVLPSEAGNGPADVA